MLPVGYGYKRAISAPKRRILGKVSVNYSDPFLDPSISVETNEEGCISQTLQAADVTEDATRKWIALDGTWVLDGSWFPCPDNEKDARNNQMGWWGSTLAGVDGSFSTPYPALTITFSARPVRSIAVSGDSKRGEYPVDFNVLIYAEEALVYTENITDNDQVNVLLDLNDENLSGITKFVLEITKWSHPGRVVKILECFATIEETYLGDDIFSINLIEEREFSDGTLPVGNVSANELTININNLDRRFDAGNVESKLYGLIKPNRKIRAWIGIETDVYKEIKTALMGVPAKAQMATDGVTKEIIWIPLGVFWSGEWGVPEDDIYAETSARDRLDLLTRSTFAGPVYKNISVYELFVKILNDTGFPFWVDPALDNQIIPWAWFDNETHRECLRITAEASLSQVYADREGVIRVEGPDYLATNKATPAKKITTKDYFSKNNPANYTELANYIEIETTPLVPASSATEIYKSDVPESIKAGETKTITIYYDSKPVIDAVATLSNAPAGLGIDNINYYAWGAEVTVSGAATDGTFIIKATGKKLEETGSQKIAVKDDKSIRENGKLVYAFAKNQLIQTVATAKMIAQKCLELSKDARRDLELNWRGDMALELGDKLTVPDSKTTTADFYITSTELSYDGGLTCNIKGKKVV